MKYEVGKGEILSKDTILNICILLHFNVKLLPLALG